MFGTLGWEAWFTAGVVIIMVIALVRELARPDLVMLGCLGLLLAAGVVTPSVAFAGFSNPSVLTIAALFIVAAGVQQTNGLARLERLLFATSAQMHVTLLRLMVPTALLSALVNNTPLVAMLLPRLQHWAERESVAASKVMMPLSFAAVLGGMITLIGTSTNLVVSGLMQESIGRGFGLFDLTWVGLPAAAAGIAYFAFLGHRLLPEHGGAVCFAAPEARRYHFELRVGNGSPLAGRTVEEAGLRSLQTAYLSHLQRTTRPPCPVGPEEVLQEGDVLSFAGDRAMIDALLLRPGLERPVTGLSANGRQQLPLFEAVVSSTSSLVGQTLREVGFRERFQGVVLAIQRSSEEMTSALGSVRIQPGDLLLIEARPGFEHRWNARRDEFYLVAPCRVGRPVPGRRAHAALLIAGAMVVATATGVLPLVSAAFVAALALLAAGCLSLDEARQSLDLPVLVMVAAAFGIGAAVETTGLAGVLAHALVTHTIAMGPLAVLAAVYLATNIMTEVLTNAAAAALVVPVALAAAADLQVDPLPFGLAVAVAASAGFSTPFGYQTNLMVMSAGRYRFLDYTKAGLPLNLIVMVVALFVIAQVWL